MKLVIQLLDEGINKANIIKMLEEEHARVSDDSARWMAESVIGDVLDMMVGYFVPSKDNSEVKQFVERVRAAPSANKS